MAEKRRASGQRGCFGGQKTTPKGGVIREGWRGEGADQRIVGKRLKLTPGETHRAEYETCDQEDCSSSKRCKQCAKFTKQNIKNARAHQTRREKYKRMAERMGKEERQEINKKRREEYKPYMPIKTKADKGDIDAQWRLAWAYADGKLGLDKDDQMAFNYFQMMAEKKDCRALWRMALAYQHGWHCQEVNDAKALECFELLMGTESGFRVKGLSKAEAVLLNVADLPGGELLLKALLADDRVDPNFADPYDSTALM